MLKYVAKPYILTIEYNRMHINCPIYDMICLAAKEVPRGN